MPHSIEYTQNIRPIFAAIRSVPVPVHEPAEAPSAVKPFITISREPGAGAWTLAQQLVAALEPPGGGEHVWTCWDRELMEKVATDQNIHAPLMQSLEESSHSWLSEFFGSLSMSDETPPTDEASLYSKVAGTVRALAQAGHTIIVGGGGVFITRRMPGGIHIRLIAPLEHRIAALAQREGISKDEAAARIRQLEKNRRSFFKRYWPKELIGPESFTVTLNTARIKGGTMVEIIRALVRQVEVEQPVQPVR
jgi:cytidylate kinase